MDHAALSPSSINKTSSSVPVALPDLGALRASGKDALGFLHGQLSADLHALADGDASFACLCNAKGGVLALLWVERRGDDFVLVGRRALLPGVLNHLERFRLRAEVNLRFDEDRAVAGHLEASARRYASEPGAAATQSDDGSWRAAELEDGVCWLDEHSAGAFLPQMLGFDALGAVNFRKGCYPGQEVIARARYLGRVKRHPWVIDIGSAPDIQSVQAIRLDTGDGDTDGVIVDRAPLPDGLRLFCVARAAPGTPITAIELGGAPVDVVRAAPPGPLQGSPST